MKIRYFSKKKFSTPSDSLTISGIIAFSFIIYFISLENVSGNSRYKYHQAAFFTFIVMPDFFDRFPARQFTQVFRPDQFLKTAGDQICQIFAGSSLLSRKRFPSVKLLISI